MYRNTVLSALFLSLSLLTACGGGGGTDSSASPDSNTSSSTASTFSLLDQDLNAQTWSFTGPVLSGSASLKYLSQTSSLLRTTNTDGSKTYSMDSSGTITIKTNASGATQVVALPGSFPGMSWAMDMAYDSTRNMVAVISLGGVGYIYRFDASKNVWLDYHSANNNDYIALAYDSKYDIYITVTTSMTSGQSIHTLGIDGSFKQSYSYAGLADATDIANYTTMTSSSTTPDLRVAALGNDIALVGTLNGSVKSIWKFNLTNLTGPKTYTAP